MYVYADPRPCLPRPVWIIASLFQETAAEERDVHNTVIWHVLPCSAAMCSSAMAPGFFMKVKCRFLGCLRIRFAAICRAIPTVVKPPDFYYVFTTIACRNLPHFASICHFGLFSWQNVSALSRKNIAAYRGKSRHNGSLERRNSY